MKTLVFFDLETDSKGVIQDIGALKGNNDNFHSRSIDDFKVFIRGADYACGHNIILHDLKFLQKALAIKDFRYEKLIDTLYLSPLLFPCEPYHKLVKDDKLINDQTNNPVNDAAKAKDLFHDELAAWSQLPPSMKKIFTALLSGVNEFKGFFHYVDQSHIQIGDTLATIEQYFENRICNHAPISQLIAQKPVALAYALALIDQGNRHSITPPWVVKNFPETEAALHLLRLTPCLKRCNYCNEALDPAKGLKKFFGYKSYRNFDGEPLQEKAVQAATAGKSLLAVFPTGGGKSLTFQVPALMAGEATNGLTVVISPLQSLMKDQVDNLLDKDITQAVTINGLLDPIARSDAMKQVANGRANLLYISPESLRSKTI